MASCPSSVGLQLEDEATELTIVGIDLWSIAVDLARTFTPVYDGRFEHGLSGARESLATHDSQETVAVVEREHEEAQLRDGFLSGQVAHP